MYLWIVIIALVGSVVGCVIGYLVVSSRSKVASQAKELETTAYERDTLKKQLEDERAKYDFDRSSMQNTIAEHRTTIARLEEQIRVENEARGAVRREAELAFRDVASKIFEEKSKVFHEANNVQLSQILVPFKNDVEGLRKAVMDCYTGEVSEVKSLRESLKMLAELNQNIGREAKELTTALRGSGKVQGDWGEMLLTQLLERSGLRAGEEFLVQCEYKGENNERLRPDVVFLLPEERSIVIDSKVSLTAYTRYANAADSDEAAAAMSDHLRSINQHVAELAAKRYEHFIPNAADFVMMFVPNEGAYVAAMNADTALWDNAYAKHVVLVSPTHLIAVLKLMYQLWSRDRQTKNALRIAEETGKLYDKLVGFVADLDGVGSALDRASKSYDEAYKKLSNGRGNILSKAENIREMGIKNSKKLAANFDEEE